MDEVSADDMFVENRHPWVKQTSFRDLENTDELKSQLFEASGCLVSESCWVLDLDSTLFSTATRNIGIYGKYLSLGQTRNLAQQEALLSQLRTQDISYGVRETFERVLREKLFLENARELSFDIWKEYESFWMKEFFSGHNMHLDRPYEGAVEFVNFLKAEGAQVFYLTGRSSDLSRQGSEESLRAAGFPFEESTQLSMKPDSSWGDLEYKLHWSKNFALEEGRKLFFLDNEPENICMFAEMFPSAQLLFFHSIMSPKVPVKEISSLLGKRELFRLKSYS